MKKLDKLILSSFLGPFFLTLIVVIFILLNQHMLKYFDDIIGKDLDLDVLVALFFYFGIFITPMAIPLAVLLSSLITFNNLGEHSELIALKSLGVSLIRGLLPLLIFVILVVFLAFGVNNYLVPKAALEAYSLMYDIKQKKPALDLREGIFYDAIPGISIKANHKFPDGQTLKDIIIYDHREVAEDQNVIIADSGKMYTMFGDRYLTLDIFDGYSYSENVTRKKRNDNSFEQVHTLSKAKFSKIKIIFDLSSFGLTRTDKKWFRGHRVMRNMSELQRDMDSINLNIDDRRLAAFISTRNRIFTYPQKNDTIALPLDLMQYKKRKDSIKQLAQKEELSNLKRPQITKMPFKALGSRTSTSDSAYSFTMTWHDSILSHKPNKRVVEGALKQARNIKNKLLGYADPIARNIREFKIFQIQWHKILASSFACLSMFLIGAPLGMIIRRGGLGIPVLISIFFFVAFYVITIMGEKWAKQGIMSVPMGVWMPNAVLLVVGFFCLSRARADTRILDADFYNVMWEKLKKSLKKEKTM